MTCEPTTMHKPSERGIALILTLFLMSALSVLAASLMFLSQTETYSSMNYKMMSQARYAAESGVQKAANFLLDSTQYTVPGGVSDPAPEAPPTQPAEPDAGVPRALRDGLAGQDRPEEEAQEHR